MEENHMKNKELKGILALAVVTALSFCVIIGAKKLSGNVAEDEDTAVSEIKLTESFDTEGLDKIDKAGKTADGYLVSVREKGYGGDISMNVFFDDSGKKITKVEVTQLSETPDIGAKISEPEFLDQFKGIEAPVYFDGFQAEASAPAELPADTVLKDGTYEAKTDAPDASGFIDIVTLTVENGKIMAASWDGVTADGAKKSIMSENGEYTMSEDGLTWKAQAEALAAALIENQSLSFLTTNEQGKTDAVSGVSISVGGFISLANNCLEQAAGIEADQPEAPANSTKIDAVSGATISSTAAVKAINHAYEFLQTVK